MRRILSFLTLALFGVAASGTAQEMQALKLPTANDALYRNDGPGFYMYVDRNFEGTKTTPWEGGSYGMVRGPRHWAGKIVMGSWHEGVDIQPVRRDALGEPLDEVKAIADGTVVHASKAAGDSNYGSYVVVRHDWQGASYYSLYAHLRAVHVENEQRLQQGETLGILGYTGAGINRERAHLHLELALLLNSQFDLWHQTIVKDTNKHGIANGMNLIGIDVARFFLAQNSNPKLTIPEFLRNEEPHFAVAFPAGPHFDLVKNYPWLSRGITTSPTNAWLIKFTQGGVPIQVEPYGETLTEAKVIFVRPSDLPTTITTKGYITAEGSSNKFTNNGMKFIALISGNF